MSIHTTRPEMERFCARTLEASKMAAIGEHMANCPECQRLFHDFFQKRREFAPVVIDLSAERWLRDEHLDYEWLVAYVDDTMESDAREMTELHLRLCKSCREDVEDFVAWRREIEPELQGGYTSDDRAAPSERLWDWLGWFKVHRKPAWAIVALLAVGATIALAMLFLKNNREKQQANVSPSPSVLVSTTPAFNNNPTPVPIVTPTPQIRASPDTQPHQLKSKSETAPVIASRMKPTIQLRDGGHVVTIDRSGKLTGFEAMSPELQQSVKDFLSSEEIKRPAALTDLAGNRGDLRGEGNPSSFKLLSPAVIVTTDDRPVFKWERLNEAESYRVYVSDFRNRKVADSGILASTETQWSPQLPLKRGEVYSWAVGAALNGEEVISPSASEPEVKFRILSEEKMRELNLLKGTTNSHLALGVFYAQAAMLAEAESEFQQLANKNPDSPTVQRLLRVIRSWR
jgi:hypothetical protein